MEKRLPLAGTYNTRPGTLALSGSSGIFGVGIFGIMIFGKANQGSDKDHRLINCLQITQTDALTNTKKVEVVKRPGLQAYLTVSAGSAGAAIYVWAGQGNGDKVMTCFGATNSTLYDGLTSKGAITGKATGITETVLSGVPTICISSNDSTAWSYQDGGSASKVTDVDYPGNASRTVVGTFAHLDGYAFIMDSTGRVYNSDLNGITAWTAGAYITANSVPDVGVGCVHCRNMIVAFCKTHIDVFRNVGNATGSPLSRVDELSINIGCIGSGAICMSRDIIYFAGGTKGGSIGIYSYNGGQVKIISTSEIDALLTIAGATSISTTTVSFYGRHFVVVLAASSTFLYCIEEDRWHEWTGSMQRWYKAAGVSVASNIVDYMISNGTDGKIFICNPANIVYQDDGDSFTATIQTAKWDAGTALRKFPSAMRIIGDQESGSTLNVSWYDDDYQTAVASRSVDMSLARPMLARCGSFRRRAFLMTHTSNTAMRLEAIEFDFTKAVKP